MAGQIDNQVADVQDDPWAAAFAAINQEATQGSEEAADTGDQSESNSVGTEGANESADIANDGSENLSGTEGNTGGSDNLDGEIDAEDRIGQGDLSAADDTQNWSAEEIESFRSNLQASAEDQAINDVAKDFIKRGARHRNGALGARPDDPDIMKRDEDGVPHWFNPDTGQEFTGENPRRQANEWCEDYNRELAQLFNQECQKQINQIMHDSEPQIAVLEFAPTYENLDPIRQAMFDTLIEDYEIKDSNGNAIGYNIDLNKALAAVNRQVQMVQQYARSQQSSSSGSNPQTNSSGPALDMKSNASKTNENAAAPKSLAEAMEALQKQQLDKLNKQKGKHDERDFRFD